ncbi:diguanylate cyclase domain-containing protein [Ideonella sp.]|uniref:diguanylate cyclase domain-containing protein n=1 Tax=Ideonella sp. TaxID=1929293 RepID=UPI0035AEC270
MSDSPYVLLVEDNPGDARLVRTMFDDAPPGTLPELRWDQTVRAAGLRLGREPGCTAVLLDLGLPDCDGLEALALLRDQTEQVPIIVLSGNDDEEVGLSAVVNGAQDYLVKGSFDAGLLRRALQYAAHRKRVEQKLIQRAMHDHLTGLPTRALLLDRLRMALNATDRSGSRGALLFIDLDHFKQVNDVHGHAAGDAVLLAAAQRMLAGVRASDTVSRVGGDEFIVLLPVVGPDDAAQAVAQKLLQALSMPVAVPGGEVGISASIGVVEFAAGEASAEQLIARADEAMYTAKREGRATVRQA